jgi:nucleoside-diphosphate-sugar epimerase
VIGSFLDPKTRIRVLDAVKPNIVIHLAWLNTISNNYESDSNNERWAEATINFMERSLNREVWFINAGSSATSDESTLKNSEYGRAKRQVSNHLLNRLESNLISNLNLQYIFSIRDKRPRVINNFYKNAAGGGFYLREPHNLHDFIEVSDVIDAITTVIKNNLKGDLYVGSGELHTVGELILRASSILDLPFNANVSLEKLEAPGKPTELLKNGWYPETTKDFFSDGESY